MLTYTLHSCQIKRGLICVDLRGWGGVRVEVPRLRVIVAQGGGFVKWIRNTLSTSKVTKCGG